MNKKTILYFVLSILLLGIVSVVFIFYTSKNDDDEKISKYPQNIQEVIKNPVEKNESWRTLVDDNDFQISYSTSNSGDSFFITITAQPVLDVSIKAEQALLKKLDVEKDYLCTLPITINIPYSVDGNLSQYDFGLSFCPDKSHIFEVLEQEEFQNAEESINPEKADLR